MAGQLSYIQEFVAAYAGMLAENFFEQRIVTKTVIAASTGIPFGVWVCRRTTDDQCDLPAAAGDVTTTGYGITVLNVAQEPKNGLVVADGGALPYVAGQVIPVLSYGIIWVQAEATATAYGGSVYARITANGAGKLQLGAIRSDVDGGNATIIAGAKFLDTTASGGLCRVLIGTPNA